MPPRQPPRSGDASELLTKKLSEIENEEVEDWMQEQLRDLEYDDPDVMEAARKVFGWRKRKILMEMSYGQFLSALEKTALSEEVRQDVAQGLYNRIQRGVPRTAPAAWSNPCTDCDPILQMLSHFASVLWLTSRCGGLMLWVRPFPLQVLADASDIDIDFAPALEKAELDATGQFLETDEGSFKQHRDAEVWNDRTYKDIAGIMNARNPALCRFWAPRASASPISLSTSCGAASKTPS